MSTSDPLPPRTSRLAPSLCILYVVPAATRLSTIPSRVLYWGSLKGRFEARKSRPSKAGESPKLSFLSLRAKLLTLEHPRAQKVPALCPYPLRKPHAQKNEPSRLSIPRSKSPPDHARRPRTLSCPVPTRCSEGDAREGVHVQLEEGREECHSGNETGQSE